MMDGHEILLKAQNRNGLYIFENEINNCFVSQPIRAQMEKWHNRFGHLNYTSLQRMAKNGMVLSLDANMSFDIKEHVCETCARSENRSAGILDLVHTDICGPMNKPSIGGARYFATFIDDKTRYVSVCFLKTRDEIFDKFKEFKVFAETQTGMKIKSIRSDNGREYVSEKFTFLGE